LTALLLDALFAGVLSDGSSPQLRANCLASGEGLCARSLGRSPELYAEKLTRAWPALCELLRRYQTPDMLCDFVCAMGVAAGPACVRLMPALVGELMAILNRTQCSHAVRALRVFLGAAQVCDDLQVLFGNYGGNNTLVLIHH
jgi:hypothetical protein